MPTSKPDKLYAMRHTLAHVLAAAVQQLWPQAKFGVGPVVEDGFYYDIDINQALSTDDLAKIEAKMKELIKADLQMKKSEMPIKEAIAWAKAAKQPYKEDLLSDLQQHGTTNLKDIGATEAGVAESADRITTVSFYQTGEFTDLCRGPHLESTGQAGAFKLFKVSGAYWRGDQQKAQLQRVYGVAFATEEELNKYLEQLAEVAKRDHRKLGQQLDIFIHSEIVGAGLPLFTPKGTAMINAMMELVREINGSGGYDEVRTGHITRRELYKLSGHLEKFPDLFTVEGEEDEMDRLALKPMNCPHHIQLYAAKMRSYRDLPVRYAEFSTLHRNEPRGVLGGLTRVRSLTQDDAHAFVRPIQIESEMRVILGQVDRLLATYGLDYRVVLSVRDPKKPKDYLGEAKVWDKAEQLLERLAKEFKINYEKVEGEANFYGPKLDFMATDALGREWQVSTIQLDFNLPERFKITYINEAGDKEQPVMIHRALNGTFERMLGVLIEHYGGDFPLWLAPEQVRVLTVNDSKAVQVWADNFMEELLASDIRATLDASPESVGKKIREAEMMKVPYVIVVGDKEVKDNKVTPRLRHGKEGKVQTTKALIEALTKEIVLRKA